MALTASAQRWCDEMAVYYPHEIETWKRRGAAIARAHGKDRIGKLDLDTAMMVAGDEFLPEEGEYV